MQEILKNVVFGIGFILLIAFGWMIALSLPASASDTVDKAEIIAAYSSFKDAQNERDLEKVGAHFIDGPDFLWVSDGQSYWGREATLKRMGLFQGAAVWRVEPNLDSARVVELSPNNAMLNMRLVLFIGSSDAPSQLPFLVSILFQRVDADWRIAALLTTRDKTPQ